MICYKINVNGETVNVIGQEDESILSATVALSKGGTERDIADCIRLHSRGVSQESENGDCEHFRWKGLPLSVGDVVQIEIVESESASTPEKRFRFD